MTRHKADEPVTYFIDRALGTQVGMSLRAAGEQVELHDDHFERDTLDTEWIPVVGARRWVVLTKDTALRSRVPELLAIRSAGLAVFALPNGNMTAALMSASFVAARMAMARLVRRIDRPFLAKVFRDGSVKLWLSASGLYAV